MESSCPNPESKGPQPRLFFRCEWDDCPEVGTPYDLPWLTPVVLPVFYVTVLLCPEHAVHVAAEIRRVLALMELADVIAVVSGQPVEVVEAAIQGRLP